MVLGASRSRHTVPALAVSLGVSTNHLTKVVQSIQALGWVETTPGRQGGVELSVSTDAVTVGDVVRAVEPSFDLVECLRERGGCPLQGPCRLQDVLRRARAAFLEQLDAVTLTDLLEGQASRLLRAASIPPGIGAAPR